jgi:uncharacterized membrane protein
LRTALKGRLMMAQNVLRSFGIGAATGLRTMTGPAFAFADRSGNWNWLFRAAAAGEYIVDKLPNTPPRTMPFGLAARAVAAGLSGAAVAGRDDRLLGAVCGIAAALPTAFLGAAYRQASAKRNVPPLAAALAEDALAIALAWSVTPHKRR